jgi:hypothetical protein
MRRQKQHHPRDALSAAADRDRRVAPRRGEQARARTEKQLVYERRADGSGLESKSGAARLLGQAITQQ